MKKLLLLISIVAMSQICFSQISVVKTPKSEIIGKIAPMGQLHISCEKIADTYNFIYFDTKFKQLAEFKSFSFKDEDNAFENLYSMIMEGLQNPPKEDILIELPDDMIWLSFTKVMGVSNFRFIHSVNKIPDILGISIWMTKKKVQKVFGKYSKKKKRRR